MSAVVDLNGQLRKVDVYKENNKTILVYVPNELRIRKRLWSVGRTLFEIMANISSNRKEVTIPNNYVVKRHKIKHNLKWV